MVAGSEHTVRVEQKTASHERQMKAKTGQLQRRSNTGRSRKENPKKGGAGGKTVWGSFQDDINEYSRS
eukprot:g2841.t1